MRCGSAIYQSLELSDYKVFHFLPGGVWNQNWNEWGDTRSSLRESERAKKRARFQSVLRLAEGLEKALGGPRELSWAEIAAQIICQRNQSKGRVCFLLLFSLVRWLVGWLRAAMPLVLNGLSADSAACTSHVSPSLLSSGRGFASTPAPARPPPPPPRRALRKTIFQLTSLALALRECRLWRFFFTRSSLSRASSMAARKFMAIVVVAL
jgi:hypothetical protein